MHTHNIIYKHTDNTLYLFLQLFYKRRSVKRTHICTYWKCSCYLRNRFLFLNRPFTKPRKKDFLYHFENLTKTVYFRMLQKLLPGQLILHLCAAECLKMKLLIDICTILCRILKNAPVCT